MTKNPQKLERIELYLIEQEAKIEELSQIVTDHWKMIALLEQKIKTLEETLTLLKDQHSLALSANEIPPHW